MNVFIYICVFLYGVVFGSFLNVLIYRIPLKEEFVKTSSHCMTCGHKLAWYDNIPLFSWISLKGRCRYCHSKISPQYPIIEGLNGILWLLTFLTNGISWASLLYAGMTSALIALSVIDWRTHEIPDGFHIFIGILGIIGTLIDIQNWSLHVVGFFAIGLPLLLLYLVSKGRAIGGGDVKLMSVCGLLVGWKHIVLGFVIGCIAGSIIHIIRMKVSNAGRELAFGPYLSAGVVFSILFCTPLINWYLGIF